jgi:hypothetical protein
MIVSSQRKTRRHGRGQTGDKQDSSRSCWLCASPLALLPHPPLQKFEPILTPRPHWNPSGTLRRKGGGLTPFGNRDMASPGMNQCLALRSLAYSLSRDPANADRFQRETTPPSDSLSVRESSEGRLIDTCACGVMLGRGGSVTAGRGWETKKGRRAKAKR